MRARIAVPRFPRPATAPIGLAASSDSAERAAESHERQAPTAAFAKPARSEAQPLPPGLEGALAAPRSTGAELAPAVRGSFERRLQADFTQVRVHADDEAHALNEALGARAFTLGPDVFFRRGEYQPHTPAGQGLLAHELTHVAQQAVAPGPALVQRKIYIGKEPRVPNNWRTTTRTFGFRRGSTVGFGKFADVKEVVTNNIDEAPGGGGAIPAPGVGAGPYPRSDQSNKSLLTRDQATSLAPEVDHIVPVRDGGSNSLYNARVLSKEENNNDRLVDRPDPLDGSETDLMPYRNYRVTSSTGSSSTGIQAGRALSDGVANLFGTWLRGRRWPGGGLASFKSDVLEDLVNSSPTARARNGYRLRED